MRDENGNASEGSRITVASGGAFNVMPVADDPFDIRFSLRDDWSGQVPAEQTALMNAVEAALTVIRRLYSVNSRRDDLIATHRKLLALAQGGLVGPQADPATARFALQSLKDDIVAREAGIVKHKHLARLGAVAWRVVGIALFIAYAARVISPRISGASDWFVPIQIRDWGLLLAGASAGTWVSFAARKVTLTFEELHIPEADRLEPAIRFAFVSVLTVILALLFTLGAVRLVIGPFDTTPVLHDPNVTLLVGLLCGFSEQGLSATVAAQSAKFFRSGKA